MSDQTQLESILHSLQEHHWGEAQQEVVEAMAHLGNAVAVFEGKAPERAFTIPDDPFLSEQKELRIVKYEKIRHCLYYGCHKESSYAVVFDDFNIYFFCSKHFRAMKETSGTAEARPGRSDGQNEGRQEIP